MPRGDRTGPGGMGPMTGRAAGYCSGNQFAGFQSAGTGRGLGLGRGFRGGGRGLRNRVPMRSFENYGDFPSRPMNPIDSTTELEMLKAQSSSMEQQLESMKIRMDELSQKEE